MLVVRSLSVHRIRRPPGRSLAIVVPFVGLLGALVGGVPTSTAASDPTPIARWAMDEGSGAVADDAGAHDADLQLSSAGWVEDGHSGSGLSFANGASAKAPASALHTTNLTVTAWVRGDPENPPADGAAIVELGGRAGCGHATWGIYVKGETLAFGWKDVRVETYYEIGGFEVEGHHLWDGNWHLIAVTTSATPYDYLNLTIDQRPAGQLQVEATYDYSGIVLDQVSVGARAGNCSTPPSFTGDVDDLRIYNVQLTADQVGGLMDPVATATEVTGPVTRSAGQLGCYLATVDPVPGGGTMQLIVTPAGGTPTTHEMSWQEIGTAQFCVALDAGDYAVRATYVGVRPWQTSTSAPIDLQVTKRETTTLVVGQFPQLTSEPLSLNIGVDGHGLEPTGSIHLYENVGDVRTDRGVHALTFFGSGSAGLTIELPARAAGTYSFEAEYPGDANHEPSSAEGMLTVTQDVVPGVLTINGGSAATTSPIVTLSTEAQAAPRLVVSMDGAQWKLFDPYQASIADWSLVDPAYGGTSGDGLKTVHVRWYNVFNEPAAEATASIFLDRAAPSASAPTFKGFSGQMVNGTAPTRVAWTGSDATSGIHHYAIWQQTDGASWTALPDVTAASTTRMLAPGHTYRFRVQPVDRAGNVGAIVTGSSFKVLATQQSSTRVRYAGTWATSTSTTWWGGTARSSSARGSTASFTFSGRSVAWIGLKASNRGKANVYVNGVLKATVDLYSATTKKQLVVWSATYSTSATRTVTIKVLGTTGRPRVDVDGFVVGS